MSDTATTSAPATRAPHKPLSMREKIGYSLGDSSANLVFQLLMFFQTLYFTTIMGVLPDKVSYLLLLGRFWDAFLDPAVGILADRTKSRWGRFRPWLLWSAVPFGIVFWLTFTSPGWDSPQMMMVYSYVAYFALMTMYAINNVPYCALLGVMTPDVNERTTISTYRFVAVMAAVFVVQGLTLPLVDKFGNGDAAHGWSVTVGIYATIAVIFMFIAFFSARERVEPDAKQSVSVKEDLSATFRNIPWVILFFATLLVFIMLAFRGGSLPFFFNYNADEAALYAFLSNWGLQMEPEMGVGKTILNAFGLLLKEDHSNVRGVAFSLMGMAAGIVQIIGVVSAKPLSQRFGKRAVFATSLVATAVVTAWLMWIPADDVGQLFLQSVAWGIAYGPSIPLLWSMIADAADFSEWKYHRRATGLTFAGVVFALKAGLGVGGFLGAQVLAIYGFDASLPVTEDGLLGIRLASSVYPAIVLATAGVMMYFYPINKNMNYQMASELEERRKRRDNPSA